MTSGVHLLETDSPDRAAAGTSATADTTAVIDAGYKIAGVDRMTDAKGGNGVQLPATTTATMADVGRFILNIVSDLHQTTLTSISQYIEHFMLVRPTAMTMANDELGPAKQRGTHLLRIVTAHTVM